MATHDEIVQAFEAVGILVSDIIVILQFEFGE